MTRIPANGMWASDVSCFQAGIKHLKYNVPQSFHFFWLDVDQHGDLGSCMLKVVEAGMETVLSP